MEGEGRNLLETRQFNIVEIRLAQEATIGEWRQELGLNSTLHIAGADDAPMRWRQ